LGLAARGGVRLVCNGQQSQPDAATVVNLHEHMWEWRGKGIGRPSILGNPHFMGTPVSGIANSQSPIAKPR